MDDGVRHVFPLEMWNLELLHSLEGQLQCTLRRAAVSILQLEAHPSQRPQDSRAVEPLAVTMIAEAHTSIVSRLAETRCRGGAGMRRVECCSNS